MTQPLCLLIPRLPPCIARLNGASRGRIEEFASAAVQQLSRTWLKTINLEDFDYRESAEAKTIAAEGSTSA
jgi:hypothetical protein